MMLSTPVRWAVIVSSLASFVNAASWCVGSSYGCASFTSDIDCLERGCRWEYSVLGSSNVCNGIQSSCAGLGKYSCNAGCEWYDTDDFSKPQKVITGLCSAGVALLICLMMWMAYIAYSGDSGASASETQALASDPEQPLGDAKKGGSEEEA